jgi:hypothetical protein
VDGVAAGSGPNSTTPRAKSATAATSVRATSSRLVVKIFLMLPSL